MKYIDSDPRKAIQEDSRIPLSAPKRKGMTKGRVLGRAQQLGIVLTEGHRGALTYEGIRYTQLHYHKLYNRMNTVHANSKKPHPEG